MTLKNRWLALACLAGLLAFVSCEEEYEQSPSNEEAVEETGEDPLGRGVLTPDDYSSTEARQHGYTVIHEDTDTDSQDSRCGSGGSRYSASNLSMCDVFTDENDWYSAEEALQTSCPSGFVRVDLAGIGREGQAGADRQCRTSEQLNTPGETAHYYCPHGPNLIGYRTGPDADTHGVCKMKCDPDSSFRHSDECTANSPVGGSNPATPGSTPAVNTPNTGGNVPGLPVGNPPTNPGGNQPVNPGGNQPSTPTTEASPSATTVPDTGDDAPGDPQEGPQTANPLNPNPPNTAPTTTPPTPTTLPVIPDPVPPMVLLPDMKIFSAPADNHIVGISTWFWIDKSLWQPVVSESLQNGRRVSTTATPVNLSLRIRGPKDDLLDCGNSPGLEWDVKSSSSSCSHEWKKAGDYYVVFTITWEMSWQCIPNCGGGSVERKETKSVKTLEVKEAQALITTDF